ncbi:uncharacterized protein LOC142175298 [Nicotiana tabacum]|uniref:Uncharacterized protein LOC142175298 n=1 Tax=Nicotiana tabacum TaxID=4097 RepID=A0AC58TL85_TOBAC
MNLLKCAFGITSAPIHGKPLILYSVAQERSVGALLAQENSEGKENSLYYLSRMMIPNELNNMRSCAWGYSSQFKDFLEYHPIPDDWELTDDIPDENIMVFEVQPPQKMYFDGFMHRGGAGGGVGFVTSQGEVLPYSFMLTQLCSSNVVEYQALILGLEMNVNMKQLQLQVLGDTHDMTIKYVPRKENKNSYALSTLASLLTLPDQRQVTIGQKWVVPPPNKCESEENELEHLVGIFKAEKEEWRQPIIDYLRYGILPKHPRRRTEIHRRAPRFLYYKDTLYRRSFEGVILRCLGEDEALQALQEAHS